MTGNSGSQGRFARDQVGRHRGRHRQKPAARPDRVAEESRRAAELGELARLVDLYPDETARLLRERAGWASAESPPRGR